MSRLADIELPPDVQQWLSDVFSSCNAQVTAKLCNNPNMQEEWLDHSWIEEISRFSTPLTLSSAWTVRLQAHYLGGLRHFGMWEIADIGVLLFIRTPSQVMRSKVALLQSKRLYPTTGAVSETAFVDYEIGFARLADPEDLAHSLGLDADFDFTSDARYGALHAESDQIRAIAAYEEQHHTPVYYHFYNPWRLPFTQHVPIERYTTPSGALEMGVRVVPSALIHDALNGCNKGYSPTVSDVAASGAPDTYGWRLEEFIASELLECREGARFDSLNRPSIRDLFYRRSGPIAAAIAITVEAPPGLLD